MSKQTFRRPALDLLGIALFSFIVLGMAHESLGVAWPTLREDFGRRVSDLGLLLALGSLGYLMASAGYGWAHRRVGTGLLLSGGSVVFCVGITGFAFAPAWAPIVVSSVLLVGGGLIDTGVNAHAALAFDLRSINLLHGAYGVGATLGPIAITLSLTTGLAWRGGYGLFAPCKSGRSR